MTAAIRWLAAHPADQLDLGGLVAYPDEATARQHAGTAARVLVLLPAEAVDVLTAAAGWWHTENLPASLMDDQERALARAVNAYELAATPTQPTKIPHSVSERSEIRTLDADTNPARSSLHGATGHPRGASGANP